MFHVNKKKKQLSILKAFLTKALGTRAHLIHNLQENCQNFARAVFLAFFFTELKPEFKAEEKSKSLKFPLIIRSNHNQVFNKASKG